LKIFHEQKVCLWFKRKILWGEVTENEWRKFFKFFRVLLFPVWLSSRRSLSNLARTVNYSCRLSIDMCFWQKLFATLLPPCRGYYKCSSMRNCPARKHVERSLEDPSMLIVTYEGEHSHTRTPSTSTALNVQS
jgi:hypothetical protein